MLMTDLYLNVLIFNKFLYFPSKNNNNNKKETILILPSNYYTSITKKKKKKFKYDSNHWINKPLYILNQNKDTIKT